MYSKSTSVILTCMILTGVGRSIGVKSFYQLGNENALLVSVLYLLGQFLSVFVYLILRCIERYRINRVSWRKFELLIVDDNENGDNMKESELPSIHQNADPSDELVSGKNSGKKEKKDNATSSLRKGTYLPIFTIDDTQFEENADDKLSESDSSEMIEQGVGASVEIDASIEVNKDPGNVWNDKQPVRKGSFHGLTEESIEAISIVHIIPWFARPAISGLFNLCNAGLRWASYIYVPASKAEMLIAGSELTLSVLASRLIRKRMVSARRWLAVGIITVGLLLIGFSHLSRGVEKNIDDNDIKSSSTYSSRHTTGNLLILGQSIMSILQDTSDEIFLQETNFPATLLLGMEGAYGLFFLFTLYLVLSFLFEHKGDTKENPFFEGDVFKNPMETELSTFVVLYSIGLTMWFTLTGIFNVLSIEATSSMTRNVWKNVRTLFVWIIGLIIYYCYIDNHGTGTGVVIGENWKYPESYIILVGYLIMMCGLRVYYR